MILNRLTALREDITETSEAYMGKGSGHSRGASMGSSSKKTPVKTGTIKTNKDGTKVVMGASGYWQTWHPKGYYSVKKHGLKKVAKRVVRQAIKGK